MGTFFVKIEASGDAELFQVGDDVSGGLDGHGAFRIEQSERLDAFVRQKMRRDCGHLDVLNGLVVLDDLRRGVFEELRRFVRPKQNGHRCVGAELLNQLTLSGGELGQGAGDEKKDNSNVFMRGFASPLCHAHP